MKSASTAAQTDAILYEAINGPRMHPLCKVEYLSDAGVWTEFEDILSCNVTKSLDDSRYGSFSLLPAINECQLSFDNKAEKYTPGRGGAFDGILIRNRKIRVYYGYRMNSVNEYLLQGYFYLDNPTYNSSFGSATAGVSARDILKRSYETSLSLPPVSSQDIVTVIRWVCDRAQIPYTTSTLPLLSYGVSIDSDLNFKNTKTRDILEACIGMIVGNIDPNYRLILNDDENLELILKPDTATSADYVVDYRSALYSISKGYMDNSLLQRITFMQQDHTVDEEETLGTGSYNTTGTKTISWSGPAIYKRMSVDFGSSSSNAQIALSEVNNESVVFVITGTTIDIDVAIDGNKLQASAPFVGEFIITNNHLAYTKAQVAAGVTRKDGFTQKIDNPIIGSDSEAKAMAESFGLIYGNKLFQLSINIPGNPLLEINDKVMVFERYTNSNAVFIVTSIGHQYSADGADFKTSIELQDFGFTLPGFIWDLGGMVDSSQYTASAADLDFDVGYLWEQDLGGTASSDPTDYSYLLKVEFS